MLQSYHYAETPGPSVFGSMRKELIYPARRAKVGVLDPLDPRSAELRFNSGWEIGVNSTIDRMDNLRPGGARRRNLSGHVSPHLVAAGANRRPDAGPNVTRGTPQVLHHSPDRRSHHTRHDAAPSSVCQSYCSAHRIEQQNWSAVSKAHHQRHTGRIGYQSIRLRTDRPTMVGPHHVDRCPVNLPGADDLSGIQPQRPEGSPVVLLNRRRVIADRVTQVERGIRASTDTADARYDGVYEAIGTVQTFEAISDDTVQSS
jgi:hypothetical protein